MLRKPDFEAIAKANPSIDFSKMEEWEKLRDALAEIRKQKRPRQRVFPFRGQRVRVVDDLESDPRLVKLHRK
jgi:hypothetical protein